MQKLEFNAKTFQSGYGLPYTILQFVFLPGFAFFVTAVLLGIAGAKLTIPDVVLPVLIAYLLVSFIGFPVVSCLKIGAHSLLKKSSLQYNEAYIFFDRLADSSAAFFANVEERHKYSVANVQKIEQKRTSYVVHGDVYETVVYIATSDSRGGQAVPVSHEVDFAAAQYVAERKLKVAKIPKAYKGMEKLYCTFIREMHNS